MRRPPTPTLFPYTTLFRSRALVIEEGREWMSADVRSRHRLPVTSTIQAALAALLRQDIITKDSGRYVTVDSLDWKRTRLNSSHSQTSYAVFCLKKKKNFLY